MDILSTSWSTQCTIHRQSQKIGRHLIFSSADLDILYFALLHNTYAAALGRKLQGSSTVEAVEHHVEEISCTLT